MKSFRIVEACSIKGEHVEPGTVVDVSDADALFLVDSGRGVPAESAAPAPAADELAEHDAVGQRAEGTVEPAAAPEPQA